MVLPPRSRHVDVRMSNSSTLEDIGQLYAHLISSWLSDVDQTDGKPSVPEAQGTDFTVPDEDSTDDDDVGNKASVDSFAKWTPVFRSRLVKVSAHLRTLELQTKSARAEGNTRGEWPYEKYARLVAVQSKMVGNLVQLSSALGALSPAWRRTLLHRTPVLNPNLVSDVMAVFGIVTMSLRTGKAISEVLPRSLVDRVYYHQQLARLTGAAVDEVSDDDDDEAGSESVHFAKSDKTIRSHHHHDILSKETLTSEEYAFYATGLAGAFQILLALDEARSIVADLCGEAPLRGYEEWRREFELRQLGERV